MLSTAAIFLLVLGVLVFFHEFGHFIVARFCGVQVLTFSLGFGPKLWARTWGGTEYCLSVVPLGGYVRMLGDDPTEEIAPENQEQSFLTQSLSKKIAIVVAGPLFNLMLAFFIFAGVFMVGVPVLTPDVGEVQEGSAAALGGMKPGDRIAAINDEPITEWDAIRETLQEGKGAALRFKIVRGQTEQVLTITPIQQEVKDIFGEPKPLWIIGIAPSGNSFVKRHNPFRAIYLGLERTAYMTELTFVGIVKLIEGKVSSDNIGGPILIAQMVAKQAESGVLSVLLFTAFISINLGVLNLFPVPVLDGGHLLFFLIEGLMGRPVSVRTRERAQQVGLFLLVSLMLFAFYNDFMRIDIIGFFRGLGSF